MIAPPAYRGALRAFVLTDDTPDGGVVCEGVHYTDGRVVLMSGAPGSTRHADGPALTLYRTPEAALRSRDRLTLWLLDGVQPPPPSRPRRGLIHQMDGPAREFGLFSSGHVAVMQVGPPHLVTFGRCLADVVTDDDVVCWLDPEPEPEAG